MYIKYFFTLLFFTIASAQASKPALDIIETATQTKAIFAIHGNLLAGGDQRKIYESIGASLEERNAFCYMIKNTTDKPIDFEGFQEGYKKCMWRVKVGDSLMVWTNLPVTLKNFDANTKLPVPEGFEAQSFADALAAEKARMGDKFPSLLAAKLPPQSS